MSFNGLRLAAGTLLLQKAQFLSAERLLKESIENSPSLKKVTKPTLNRPTAMHCRRSTTMPSLYIPLI
jgi:hypothetical protein